VRSTWTAGSLILGVALSFAQSPALGVGEVLQGQKDEGSCGRFGTSVEFVGTPSEAARQAKKEEKLVFVLHVSGHFEDPKLT
jgi:hypothetical protein